MPGVGQFHVTARLTGPGGASESVRLLVDTGATFLTVPRALADRLRLETRDHQRVVTAGGAQTVWPVADVRIAVEGRETPTPCFIAPGGEPLLGAVALESLFLLVDPVERRLVPTIGRVLAAV